MLLYMSLYWPASFSRRVDLACALKMLPVHGVHQQLTYYGYVHFVTVTKILYPSNSDTHISPHMNSLVD